MTETTTKTGRLSWRKRPRPRWGAPESHGLFMSGRIDPLATVQAQGSAYFWYGMGENTTNRPTDLASAKAEAMAHVRKCLARQAEPGEPEAEEEPEAGPRHP